MFTFSNVKFVVVIGKGNNWFDGGIRYANVEQMGRDDGKRRENRV